MDRYGFLKTAAAIPSVRVADCAYNGERIAALVAEAAGRGVEVVLFPELKKGPYIEPKLEARVIAQNEGGKKSVIKTWSRASMISPDFVGQTIAVHNGNKFIPVYVTENMVGHKLGEFAPTRNFRGHSGNKKK